MVAEITVNNTDEFQELVDNKDIRIAKAIVDGILENMNNKKKHVRFKEGRFFQQTYAWLKWKLVRAGNFSFHKPCLE